MGLHTALSDTGPTGLGLGRAAPSGSTPATQALWGSSRRPASTSDSDRRSGASGHTAHQRVPRKATETPCNTQGAFVPSGCQPLLPKDNKGTVATSYPEREPPPHSPAPRSLLLRRQTAREKPGDQVTALGEPAAPAAAGPAAPGQPRTPRSAGRVRPVHAPGGEGLRPGGGARRGRPRRGRALTMLTSETMSMLAMSMFIPTQTGGPAGSARRGVSRLGSARAAPRTGPPAPRCRLRPPPPRPPAPKGRFPQGRAPRLPPKSGLRRMS